MQTTSLSPVEEGEGEHPCPWGSSPRAAPAEQAHKQAQAKAKQNRAPPMP